MFVYYIASPDSVPVYTCISFVIFVITHRSIVLSVFEQYFDQQIQLMLAPNMPCMLLVIILIIGSLI